MKSFRTHKFRSLYEKLPKSIQEETDKSYRLWRENPRHPSLHFKLIYKNIWSIRITLNYRALGLMKEEGIFWFWIGKHDEYERLIRKI